MELFRNINNSQNSSVVRERNNSENVNANYSVKYWALYCITDNGMLNFEA